MTDSMRGFAPAQAGFCPTRPPDNWGPITAAAIFLIILAGLIVFGSGAHL
jgi:hypothetical protein